tara:strand:- start:85 stop:348 length:264 start_codon:yes stop_codon:yes gene_type:complete
MGTPVNTAAFVQLAAAIPNYVLMEANGGNGDLGGVVTDPVQLVDGYRIVPDKTGIGIDVDEAAIERQPPFEPLDYDGDKGPDGSVVH